MAKTGSKEKGKKKVETLTHEKAKRLNIPTAEYQSVMRTEELSPVQVAYERRNRDLDPQLVWRGKDEQDWSNLVVPAPPLYIQEKIHPKVLIDDLQRRSDVNAKSTEHQIDLFANFNGLPSEAAKTEFYQHDAHWANRMILGDSLQVMASLAEREGLRGKVQCIYVDPPYGIKFNSNFQWSTTSHDVKDGDIDQITREPEQVKAFRDTWRDGVHSYLTYLRDRLTVARDLLAESGSIFVQMGDENVHRVRAVMEEIFGEENFRAEIKFKTTGGHSSSYLASVSNSILWFAKGSSTKYRALYFRRQPGEEGATQYKYGESEDGRRGPLTWFVQEGIRPKKIFQPYPLASMGTSENDRPVEYCGKPFKPTLGRHWSVKTEGTLRIAKTGRLFPQGENLRFAYFLDDYPVTPLTNT
jgi:adenine-specific DNA-methyltransferase